MKIILLSGGSGKRLWPLSNEYRAKQFLKILDSSTHIGGKESMVQRVWGQLERLNLTKDTIISTGENQRSILKSQLSINEEKIITEPTRRDTFPAIVLSCAYLKSILNADNSETVVILPVDPFVDDAFFNEIFEFEKLLIKEKSVLGLIGVNPTFPSEKYGYIVPDELNKSKVSYFVEKPNMSRAEELISKGAVWNAGVFSFRLSTLLDYMKLHNISTDYFELITNYEKLPKRSFDYEFVEKQENILFKKYNGYWKDIGTWNTLTDEMTDKSLGKAELIECNNTHVINELNIPVATIGLNDSVVVAGPEGILVTKKDMSPRVKEIDDSFFNTSNFIEETWGVQNILIRNQFVSVIHICIIDKGVAEIEIDKKFDITVLSGKGKITEKNNQIRIVGEKNYSLLLTIYQGV